MRRLLTMTAAGLLILATAGCSGSGGSGAAASQESGDTAEIVVKRLPDLSGVAEQLADSGHLRIGVKVDQPGLGYVEPGSDGKPSGFDIEIGKIIAGALGIKSSGIEWVPTVSANREKILEDNSVDLVIASYSMTRSRMEEVGMAGPYFITGAQMLVRKADAARFSSVVPGPNGSPRERRLPASLNGRVCTGTGSTTASVITHEFKQTVIQRDNLSECVTLLQQGTVDAVITDGAIVMGYAHTSGGSLVVAGDPFTEEKYGIGFAKGSTGMCSMIQSALVRAYKDGSWLSAFNATLGKAGVDTPPEPPALDPCQ